MIDPEYFIKSNRLNIENETRLAMSLEEAKEWTKKRKEELANTMHDDNAEQTINFVTECFFLTMKSFHLGMRVFSRYM
jgi:hypothetical protein